MQLVEAHRRFQANLETLFEDEFLALWGATSGLCDPEARWHSFSETTSALGTHPGGLWADSMSSRLGSVESGLTSAIDDYAREAEGVRRADVSHIASLKVALTDGVTVLEVYEAEVLRKASARLLEVAATLPATLERYLHELTDLGC